VGALVTLQLPPESPVRDLPWIITFGPLSDAEDWEPVVCGPYERPHALALAEEVVADEELMAVVEPLLSYVAAGEIRDEIGVARAVAQPDETFVDRDGLTEDDVADADSSDGRMPGEVKPSGFGPSGFGPSGFGPDGDPDDAAPEVVALPTPAEVRAGMARVVRQLAD
jgi:hypothetical protein